LTELSQALVLDLIDKIVVHEAVIVGGEIDNTSGKVNVRKAKKNQTAKTQKIEIHYSFVGNLNNNMEDIKQDNTITPDISSTPTLYISQPA